MSTMMVGSVTDAVLRSTFLWVYPSATALSDSSQDSLAHEATESYLETVQEANAGDTQAIQKLAAMNTSQAGAVTSRTQTPIPQPAEATETYEPTQQETNSEDMQVIVQEATENTAQTATQQVPQVNTPATAETSSIVQFTGSVIDVLA